MRITIVFDVEDYITPPEAGLDDLLGMLATVMTEQRVRGTFFLIGEKLRSLRARGRSDVIAAVARHDLGSHINMGSIHPTLTERLERAGWADGTARMAADEIAGVDELSALAGKPIRSLARHGGSYSPQLLAVLGMRGYPYVYSPAALPGHNLTWFCNTLNFAEDGMAFQEAFHTKERLREAEIRFQSLVETREKEGLDWILLFHSHPCHIKTATFWDQNYAAGANPPPEEWVVPDFYPEFSMERVRANWAALCARLRENTALDIRSISDWAAEFGSQAAEANAPEIRALAAQAAESAGPFYTERFSAAEILDILARAYLQVVETGAIPERLPRRTVFGPTEIPLAYPTARRLHSAALARLARGIVAAVEMTGLLPSRVRCGEGALGSAGEIGAGSALRALGEALVSNEPTGTVLPRPAAPYPEAAENIVDRVRGYRSWPIHRLDLDMATLCRLTALQCWTLKPAWPGKVPDFSAG